MCAGDEVEVGKIFKARNGSSMGITKNKSGKLVGTVIKATDRKYPLGTQVKYQSAMGHVLCKGQEEGGVVEECDLHPLDAVEIEWKEIWDEAPQRIKEALRRRRANKARNKARKLEYAY
jgi:hypothetical protein